MLHPGLNAGDLCVAYHGTKNTNRVMHILHEGYDPKYNKPGGSGFTSADGAYFGVRFDVAQQYGGQRFEDCTLPRIELTIWGWA